LGPDVLIGTGLAVGFVDPLDDGASDGLPLGPGVRVGSGVDVAGGAVGTGVGVGVA
jgi:hypothetical protein